MHEYAIEIENLKKSFKKLDVLKGVNLTVKPGEVLTLLGPNGAGKTTIIRILSTLLKPDSGKVIVNGYNLKTQAQEIRQSIGLTGQYTAVDEYLTGLENLEMMGRLYHLNRTEIKQRVPKLLEQFDLMEAARRPVKNYSGGMRRKLDLAAGLIASPPIVFLDEPTSSLDPRSRLAVWEIIKYLVSEGITVFLTTQHLEEADTLADRVAVINGGRIIANDTPERLKNLVGKERLELVFKTSEDFARALTIIKGSELYHDQKTNTVSLAVERGVIDIQEILNRMEKAGIQVETLTLRKPTLDDVFMHFTGRKSEEGEGLKA
ncbi:ATP-binding cassette domain-containing protein [Atribacter laminatus]|uniref:Daunorubicin/doxorubicin resistance ATP-binding protein DrrA n=1 Tax=Atribacter laminatus TaxID=2847778 RepID=A0A7T1ANF1_ATRLM|nr:ATP-binding cassette domain-containing protein [Atribacter laminatus]QPM69134.1 Daunorubicin/doxorubicin resistance ATP-binding protein DrrA [Atribacter laminatus]